MRFLTLILPLLFVPSLYAEVNWTYPVSPDNHVGIAAAFRDFEDKVPRIIDGEEGLSPSLIIYFRPKDGCYPMFLIMAGEETTSLQLRVDEREVYRPPQVKWQKETKGVWFSFIDTSDTSLKGLERAKIAFSLLSDLREGNNVRAKLEPSGKVMLWRLRGSAKAIQEAGNRCKEGSENKRYFPK